MNKLKIKIGMASCGIAAGADKIFEKVNELISSNKINAEIDSTGCIGMCFSEPLMELSAPNKEKIIYGEVTPEDVEKLANDYMNDVLNLDKAILAEKSEAKENENLGNQTRIVLRNCGVINPESLAEYRDNSGYDALKKVITEMKPIEVADEIYNSGLRGRGGAGFPTGLKWKFALKADSDKKYIVCNADEGDPGAFMDRSVLEGDPHSIIEGMAIGAYSIGADEGYIYCRAEYPLAIKRLKKAIKDAEDNNLLGEKIFGSDFSFKLKIKKGAGAFVCGEETALIASIEGKRGMPRIRPPYPAQSGLWGKPTNINNVETFANIAWIINNGFKEFKKYGTEDSPGTKVFALAGKIKKSGLIEVPMGMSLRDVIYKVGGGILNDKPFKAVQLGGPSGGCVPASLLDTPIDYASIQKTGAIMGSGGMVVMDEDTCIVDVAKFFLNFTQDESCGKCTFCRIGTKRMLEILVRISEGKGKKSDIETLDKLSKQIISSSLCGLGQTAPNPVLTTLKYFKDEYEAHILEKKCPAGVCTSLIKFEIIEDKCVGCTACSKACPVNTIEGKVKEPHKIIQENCIKCGQCYDICKFNAITKG